MSDLRFYLEPHRQRWSEYIDPEVTKTYGTYDRKPEYAHVAMKLFELGMETGDMLLDVGAGPCDMDRFLRQVVRWHGRYVPLDGATHGIDFNDHDYSLWPRVRSEWVCAKIS